MSLRSVPLAEVMARAAPGRAPTANAPAPGLLYVGNFLTGGHNRSYCFDLASQLEHRGWRVTRTSSQVPRIARLFDMLRTAWTRRRDYDVVVVDVFSGAAFVWAEAVCFELRRLGKPYVLTLHGGRLPEFASLWPRRVRRLLRSATAVTAPSDFLRSQMRGYRDDIALVPNAVDASAFRFAVRMTARPRLIWVRAFHAMYNPGLAIDALAGISRRFPEATLTMIGPDKGDGSLAAARARAHDLGVAGRVTMVGHVEHAEVMRHLAKADIFINTTDVDNTPVSVLEAMATGLCVVTTAVGGLPYLVEDERSGLLVPPRDPAAMARAIERVLLDSAATERISRGARERACQHDWDRVLDQWARTLLAAIRHD
jgi:glycosyltransferase involved in cell wall biosynthesis